MSLLKNVVMPGPAHKEALHIMSTPTTRAIFNVVSLVPGMIGLPMLLLAILFGKTMRRGAVFINFICSVFILALSAALLPLAGQQDELRPRSRELCYLQTVIMDGAVTMTPCTSFALVLQLCVRLYRRQYRPGGRKNPGDERKDFLFTCALIALPYLTFLGFAFADVFYFWKISEGNAKYDVMNPAFYCKVTAFNPFVPFGAVEVPIIAFNIIMGTITLGLEAFIGYMIFRTWKSQKAMDNDVDAHFPLASLIRLTLFTLYRVAIVGVAISVVQKPGIFPTAEFFHGAIPGVVFFIFALQRDAIMTWVGWFKAIPSLFTCCTRPRPGKF